MTETPPDETAEEAAARARSSAQSTAHDLARMGIDPRALGLDAEPSDATTPASRQPVEDPHEAPAARTPALSENVVPLRPDDVLPASGTSSAWEPAPPVV